MDNSTMDFLDIFTVAVCVYLLYCGVFNRGQLYKDDTIHKSKKEQYRKTMRLFALVVGPVGILSVVFQRFGNLGILGWICYGISLLLIVLMVIFCYRMTEQYVNKQLAKTKGSSGKKKE